MAAVWSVLSFTIFDIPNTLVIILMLIVIAIPVAWLLLWLPAVLLYLTAAAPLYLLLRRRSRAVAALTSAAIVAIPATLVPMRANHAFEEQMAAVTANDGGGPIALRSGQRVAYLSNYNPDYDWNASGCSDLCQRLLFSGTAREVLLGDVSALNGKSTLTRYWIGPARGPCPKARVSNAYADDQDVGRHAPYPRPFLASKLAEIYGDGNCFYEARVSIDAADVVLVDVFKPYGNAGRLIGRFDPRLTRVNQSEYKAIYVRSGDQLRQVMRRSHASGSRADVPLSLMQPFTFDTYDPGHWTRGASITVGRRRTAYPSEFLTNDLSVRGLVTEALPPR